MMSNQLADTLCVTVKKCKGITVGKKAPITTERGVVGAFCWWEMARIRLGPYWHQRGVEKAILGVFLLEFVFQIILEMLSFRKQWACKTQIKLFWDKKFEDIAVY